jgi:serine/threonine-protein kinase
MAIIIQHMQNEPPAPSKFVEVHPRLDALVLRLLAKEPSQRPASAEEVRRELKLLRRELVQDGTAVAARPSSPAISHVPSDDSEAVEPTMVRATPMPASRPTSLPGVSQPPALARTQASVSTDVILKAARPDRRPLMAALLAVVALAGLGVWAMRGQPATSDAPPPVAEAPKPPPVSAPPPPPPPAAPVPLPAPQPEAPAADSPPAEDDGRRPVVISKRGTLKLVVRGSGTIRVDGRIMGEVPPLNTLSLPEGAHKLEILNPRAYPYRAMITITSGQQLIHRVALRPRAAEGRTP